MAVLLAQQQTGSLAAHTGLLTVPAVMPALQGRPNPDGSWSRDQIISLVLRKADENHFVPWEFLGLMMAEGLDVHASRPVSQEDWRRYWEPPQPFDVSFGLGQHSARYTDEYAAWCRSHGMSPDSAQADAYPGDDVIASIRDAYYDPYHALDVTAVTYRYWRYNPEVPYLTAACAYNGPSYYHRPEASPNYRNYRDSGILARSVLGLDGLAQDVPLIADRVFSEDTPDIVTRQLNDWTCSVRSTYAGLYQMASRGLTQPVTYGDGGSRDVYDWMVPEYAAKGIGLLNHTGAGMADMLRSHGYTAGNLYPASLADVQQRAGRQPVMIGGISWGHWVDVRGIEADGTLILENPAPGWDGVYDLLRDSFPRLGDGQGMMSMVWIDV
jgi:hypothetical protein